jgi:hypothetical protein
LLEAIGRGRRVEVGAYLLDGGAPIVRALEGAARRGAFVSVRLQGEVYRGAGAGERTLEVARELRSAGVRVVVGGGTEPLHLKAAVVDGVAFLDDRNFPWAGDTVVRTRDAAAVGMVRAALEGRGASRGRFATEKRAALWLEARAIATGSGDAVAVESESFGFSTVAKALRARALGGAEVRLLVSALEYRAAGTQERSAVARLEAAGVSVRVGRSDEKLCVAGDRGWVGSANATFPEPMLDWGAATRSKAVLTDLRAAFERNWDAAQPVAPA